MITRRDLIISTVSIASTSLVFLSLGRQSDTTQNFSAPESPTHSEKILSGISPEMDRFFSKMGDQSKLGQAWLASFSDKPQLKQLAQTIRERLDVNSSNLENLIKEQIKKDFISHNICSLEGWTLSLLECQLAGLQVLSAPNRSTATTAGKDDTLHAFTLGSIAEMALWGPQETTQHQPFNVQNDGHSGLWFQFKNAPPHVKIMIDGEICRTVVSEKVVTSGLYEEMAERILSTPGSYAINLVDPIRKIYQPVGNLTVHPDPFSSNKKDITTYCKIKSWGPKKARAGFPENVQPNGNMGMWFKTRCNMEGVSFFFGEEMFQIQARDFGFTSSIPVALLEAPGQVTLQMQLPNGEKTSIGEFIIE